MRFCKKICTYCSYSLNQTVCRITREYYQSRHVELYANICYQAVTITCAARSTPIPPTPLSLFGSLDDPPLLPHTSLHFLRVTSRDRWQEATSVCQLCHKYIQGRGSVYGVPAQGRGCVMTSSCLG